MLFEKNPSVFLVEKHFQFYFSFLILSVLSMEYSQTRQIKRTAPPLRSSFTMPVYWIDLQQRYFSIKQYFISIYIVGTNLIKFHLQQNKQEKLDKVPVSEAHKFFLTIYMYIYFNKSVQACFNLFLESKFSRELPLHSGAALPCLSTGLTSSKEIPKGRLFAFDPEGQYLISCDKTAVFSNSICIYSGSLALLLPILLLR
jgi:hypothetical protein